MFSRTFRLISFRKNFLNFTIPLRLPSYSIKSNEHEVLSIENIKNIFKKSSINLVAKCYELIANCDKNKNNSIEIYTILKFLYQQNISLNVILENNFLLQLNKGNFD